MTTAVPSLMKFEGCSALEADRAPVRRRRIDELARDDDMTTNPRLEAALALHRFGFGPVAGSIAAIADDPRGALLADLERPGAGRVAAANLPNSGQAARAFLEFRAERQAKEKLAQRAKKEAEAKGMVVGMADGNAMKPNADAQAPTPEPAPSAEPAAAIARSARSKRGQSPHRSRRRRGYRLRRAPCLVLVESLLCFGRQDRFDGRCL